MSTNSTPPTGSRPRPRFAAHTPNAMGRWQPLFDHLTGVEQRARQFADSFGAGTLASWAAWLHDLGKYDPNFQRYLDDCWRAERERRKAPPPGTAPHKQLGARYARRIDADLLAFVILGHHGGMPGIGEVLRILAAPDPSLDAALEAILAEAKADGLHFLDTPPSLAAEIRALGTTPRETELLTRLLYSCLVDADALDTEAHRCPDAAGLRQRAMPSLEELRDLLRKSQLELIRQSPDTPLNRCRREVWEACVRAAAGPPGLYRLTVPTGGGKTRSSLAFALEHACSPGRDLRRVIYALPYTSIVDQTAAVFEELFGTDVVLEHHSAIDPLEEDADEAGGEAELWRRLACQNWDAPLIVTTTVQLFESLFGNRPGRCRKVHRLARAVIVLDEVQALPPKLLKPIVDGLRTLVERCGTTVLLCTATQPALDRSALESVGLDAVTEIAPEPDRLFRDLRRVEYDLTPLADAVGWTWERVADEMRASRACLTVVNSRRDALALLDALDDPEALHLSTLLCGRHRRAALAEIRRRLADGAPCRVVSTQVVECGCDLDFPRVLRALGPLDRIVQAAGRCNREGRNPPDESRVTVFRPADGRAPRGSYRVAMSVAERLLHTGVDLHDPAVYERYFRETFAQDETDARGILLFRERLDFPEVAHRMRLIDESTVGVLVRYEPYAAEYDALLQAIQGNGGRVTAALWRRAQPLMASVTASEFQRYRKQGVVREASPGCGLWLWEGGYDRVRGLTDAPIDPVDLIL